MLQKVPEKKQQRTKQERAAIAKMHRRRIVMPLVQKGQRDVSVLFFCRIGADAAKKGREQQPYKRNTIRCKIGFAHQRKKDTACG